MWEFRCGICDVPCQSVTLLEKHNDCPRHITRLKKLNMFPILEPHEFTLLQLSRPTQDISKEGKYLNLIICILYSFFLY